MTRCSLTLIAIAALAVVAVAPTHAADESASRSVRISKAEYGKRWPFTVKAGVLACSEPGAVTFTTGGVRYAVNGTAIMFKRGRKINRIWRNDPAYPGMGLKVNIGPIIDRGLKLC